MSTQSFDPRTGKPFGPLLADTDDAEVRAVCQAAARAGQDWAVLPPQNRADVLESVADALDAAGDRLVPLADSETALGAARLAGELARTTFQLRLLSGAVRTGRYTHPSVDAAAAGAPPEGHPELRRALVPIGPVAVYGASNFPFAFSVPGGDTASALAAGCSVVVKAHPGHPQTSEEVCGVMREGLAGAGVSEELLGMVRGFSAGSTLIQEPAIRAAAFTGSRHAGRALFDMACARPDPIPFYGELGSVNPVVILPSAASRPGLARDYVDALLLGAGQFCTNPSIIYVPDDEVLVQEIVAEVATRSPGVLLHRGVAEEFERNVARVMSVNGVSVLAGDPESIRPAEDGSLGRAPLLLGTTLAKLRDDRTPLEVECFGPAGLVVRYGPTDDLPAVLESMDGALAGCVHGDVSDPAARDVVAALAKRVGRVAWNAWPTGVAVTESQHHGGPWPATTSPLHTSVGVTAIRRFLRPVVYQSLPEELLPAPLGNTI